MENKIYGSSNSPLNTINIAYSLKFQAQSHLSQLKKEVNEHQSSFQIQNNNIPQHEAGIQSPESEFNDFNLKYGKSQTLKQSVFNRMRIHVYRREKRAKWLQLPNYNQSDNQSLQTQYQERPQSKSLVRNRENKTSLNRRKIRDLSYHVAKTNAKSQQENNSFTDKQSGQHFQEFQMVNQEKIDRIVKNLIKSERLPEKNFAKNVQEFKSDEFKIIRKKYRNLSDSINSFPKKHPIQLKKLFSPPKLPMPFQDKKLPSSSPKEANEVKRQDFQAWDNSDLYGSNKNGIVEYAKQCVIEQSTTTRPQSKDYNIFSSKKRRKFLIKDKK